MYDRKNIYLIVQTQNTCFSRSFFTTTEQKLKYYKNLSTIGSIEWELIAFSSVYYLHLTDGTLR